MHLQIADFLLIAHQRQAVIRNTLSLHFRSKCLLHWGVVSVWLCSNQYAPIWEQWSALTSRIQRSRIHFTERETVLEKVDKHKMGRCGQAVKWERVRTSKVWQADMRTLFKQGWKKTLSVWDLLALKAQRNRNWFWSLIQGVFISLN